MDVVLNDKEVEALGKRVRALRIGRDLTQTDFCKKTGIARQTLFNVENAKRPTRPATLSEVAQGFDMTLDELLDPILIQRLETSSPLPSRQSALDAFIRRKASTAGSIPSADCPHDVLAIPVWERLGAGTKPMQSPSESWLLNNLPQLPRKQWANLRYLYARDNALLPILGRGDPALINPADTTIPAGGAGIFVIEAGDSWMLRFATSDHDGMITLGAHGYGAFDSRRTVAASEITVLARVVCVWQMRNLLDG